MKCSVCNNELKWRMVDLGRRGAKGSKLLDKVEYCAYCEWKGASGPGAQLRAIIKEANKHGELNSQS